MANGDQYIRNRIIPHTRGETSHGGQKVWDDPTTDVPVTDAIRGLAERNWQEQCFLIEGAHNFSELRKPGGLHDPENGAEHYYKLVGPEHGTVVGNQDVEFGSDIVSSMFSKYKDSAPLYSATSHVISALVPEVKIWKVVYKSGSDATSVAGSEYDEMISSDKRTVQLSIPMEFNIHTTFQSINDIMRGTNGKTDDVGLKSFTYKFHGGDLVTKEIAKCEMVLYFNNVESLMKRRNAYVKGGRMVKWAWEDLIHAKAFNSEAKHDSSAYEIKIELGWSGDKKSLQALAAGDKDAQAAFDALTGDGGKKQFFLNLNSHTIKFNQDGSLEISMVFNARSSSRWRNRMWELLWMTSDEERDHDLEDNIRKEIKRLAAQLTRENTEKQSSESLGAQEKKAGAIPLKVDNLPISEPEKKYSEEQKTYASLKSLSSEEQKMLGVSSLEKPSGPNGKVDAQEILSGTDLSFTRRQLYVLQYKLKNLQALRRSTSYNRLFKAMDPILHRLRIGRGELGELKEGQLTRNEANKIRQPYYVEHKGDLLGGDPEEKEKLNKAWEIRSLARAFNLKPGSTKLSGQKSSEADRAVEGFAVIDDTAGNSPAKTLAETGGAEIVDKIALMAGSLKDQEEKAKELEKLQSQVLAKHAAQYDDKGRHGKDIGPERRDIMVLEYFYLGDLVDIMIKHIRKNPAYDKNLETDVRSIVFGPFSYVHPLLAGRNDVSSTINVNLADLPISARYFNAWFRRNFVMKLQESINFDTFFKLLLEQLVFKALGNDCYAGGFNSISNLGMKTVLTSRPLKDLAKANLEITSPNERLREDFINPAWSNTAVGGDFQDAFLNIRGHQQWNEYSLIFANSYVPQFLTGQFTKDRSKGVHHVFIGANKGLLKSIDFQKIESQPVQAYKIASSGAQDLREIYSMKMSMIGNNYFEPGQLVYINPTMAGLGRLNSEDYSRLGLGGYYRINTVDGIVDNGRFETYISGYWETYGWVNKTTKDLQDASIVSSGVGPISAGGSMQSDPVHSSPNVNMAGSQTPAEQYGGNTLGKWSDKKPK